MVGCRVVEGEARVITSSDEDGDGDVMVMAEWSRPPLAASSLDVVRVPLANRITRDVGSKWNSGLAPLREVVSARTALIVGDQPPQSWQVSQLKIGSNAILDTRLFPSLNPLLPI